MVCKILSPWHDERAGTPKSVAQIAVAHSPFSRAPTLLVVALPRPATARGGTRGEETLRVSRVHHTACRCFLYPSMAVIVPKVQGDGSRSER
jgi:hypothetical protein